MRKILLLSIVLIIVLFSFAHEYILLASKYRLQRGDNLEMHLVVADGFNIERERPFQKQLTRSFELITKDSTVDLSLADGSLPIVFRKVNFEGGGLIHLERDYSSISLPTANFMDYLKEDHLEGIGTKVNPNKAEQKERYSRYLKCLVQSEHYYKDSLYSKVLGQNLEIVLKENPYLMKKESMLHAKILFMGEPLINKTITARNRTGSEAAMVTTSQTNSQGECSFKISREGEWFIHVTHMIESPDKTLSDWESFWASYSFEVKSEPGK